MEPQSATSHANPRVIVELSAAKTANAENRRKIALERAQETADPQSDTAGIGFSVLRIGAAASAGKPHTPADGSPPINPAAEFF